MDLISGEIYPTVGSKHWRIERNSWEYNQIQNLTQNANLIPNEEKKNQGSQIPRALRPTQTS